MAEKKVTCPVEKAAVLLSFMNQLGITPKASEAGTEAGTLVITADMEDQQAKDLQSLVTKMERRETVASVLHKAGNLTTKAVDFTVNDVARPAVGVGLQVGAGLLGSAIKFGIQTGAKLVNEVSEAGTKCVNDVAVSEDAQKFKNSLSTIGKGFGLFDDNKSNTIKIA